MKKLLSYTTGVLFNIACIGFAGSLLFANLSQNGLIQQNVLNPILGEPTTEIIQTGKPAIRYKTWYTSVEDVLNGNGDVAKAAQAEGTVLLKNDNNALPLNKSTDKVSLFGVTAYDPCYSLDGAGEVKINRDRQEFFKSEFERVGLDVNDNLASWYNSNQQYWREDKINIYDNTSNQNSFNAVINGANWSVLPDSKIADGYNTAVFVTGRMTNEGIDIMPNNVDGKGAKDNDYLKFTDNEISVLQGLKQAKADGKIKKIVVLFNQANPVQEDLPTVLDNYDVDAALWIGYPGSDGIGAVADIIVGNTSPSGGLSTTWYTARDKNPSTPYFGASNNVLMQEDIYYGYRYAETRYEDYVLDQGNTASFDYDEYISYPFGYGLSYAEFSYKLDSIVLDTDPSKNYDAKGNKKTEDLRKEGDDYIVNVTVTNNSKTVSAKEIVQLYASKPYSATDKAHKVENAAVELVGYGKTRKLGPGESDTIQIKLDANKLLASYDGVEKTYTLEAGDYYLAIARNSHEAVNSILKAKRADGINVKTDRMDDEYGAGDENCVDVITVSKEYADNYKYWTLGEADVTNLFDHADPNIASGDPDYATFMSRSDWTATADNAKGQNITPKGDMNKLSALNGGNDFTLENIQSLMPEAYARYENEYPNYGLHRKKEGGREVAEIQLYEMIGVEYDESQGATQEDIEKWEYFLDQLTWDESVTLTSNGLRRTVAIDSIGKPYTNDVNASNAISWMFDMSLAGGAGTSDVGFAYHFDPGNRAHNPTGYPCEGIVAATFNNDIAYAVGQAIGEDGLWTGAVGLYGFGLGLHRNPYHGRAGEYYSEDSFLTGMIGGYSSKGAQSKGMYVYNKHFVLNDQETNRTGYNSWLTEQTFREVYLRPFELAIEIGDAMNVMNSFNHVGSTWSGNDYNLMTRCLRDEFNMRGFAVTDYWKSGGMNLRYGMLAGTDLPDGTGAEGQLKEYGPTNGQYGFYAQAVREACRRILYTVANSAAMNFIGEGTIINSYDPAWYKTRDDICNALNITFYVVTALYAATYLGTAISSLAVKKRKDNE